MEPDATDSTAPWEHEGNGTIEQRYDRREMNACIRGVVDSLPEQYRAVIVLSEFEGLSNDEIAGVLGISLENVKVRLHRGRARLKEALDARCTFSRDERNEFVCEPK